MKSSGGMLILDSYSPGKAVPFMRPKFYWCPWRIMVGDFPKLE